MKTIKTFFSFLLVMLIAAAVSAQSLSAWLQGLPGNRLYLRSGVYLSYGTDTQTIVHSVPIREVASGPLYFTNVPAKSTATVYATELSTGALVAKTPIQQASLTQPIDFGRNISLRFVVNKSSNIIYCPFRIDGTDHLGNITYETIIATVGAATYGNVAWILVSTITPGTVTFPSSSKDLQTGVTNLGANVVFDVGIGDYIGFGVNISTSSDVYACKVDSGGTVPTTLTYNHIYDWWYDSTVPTGTRDWIFYLRYNSPE